MGRPPKLQRVDYFPHMCKHGDTLMVIEQHHGNDGYAFWFKLLEQLGSKSGHTLDTKDPHVWEVLQSRSRLSSGTCRDILDRLARMGAIDQPLWEENGIIWSQNLVENLAEVYRSRRQPLPVKPGFTERNPDADEFPTGKPHENGVSSGESAARTGQDRIGQDRVFLREKLDQIETPADEVSLLESDCLASHSWDTFRTIWTPALVNGKFLDEDACREKWETSPAMWPQWIYAAKNYVISKRVREGYPMNPMKFLSGAWRDWQTPEIPSGAANRKPDFSWREERERDEAKFAEEQKKHDGGRYRDRMSFESEGEYGEKLKSGRLMKI